MCIRDSGSGTAKVLESHGLYPELIPEIFDGEALGKALAEKLSGTEKLLIPRAALGGRELIEELQKKGVVVDDIPTYDTLYETCLLYTSLWASGKALICLLWQPLILPPLRKVSMTSWQKV